MSRTGLLASGFLLESRMPAARGPWGGRSDEARTQQGCPKKQLALLLEDMTATRAGKHTAGARAIRAGIQFGALLMDTSSGFASFLSE